MKHFFWAILIFAQTGFTQDQLVNVYNSYSEVYGGMEDGGISRHELFYFRVNASIKLQDIYINDRQLELKKGDTLVINVSKYTPYNKPNLESNGAKGSEHGPKTKDVPVKERYKIYQSDNIYYANVQDLYIWDGTITFIFKKKTFTVKAKEGFDAGYTGYAP